MTPAISVYLDAVRFAAALLVLVGHLAGRRFTAGFAWPASAFLDDAVTVFFVLSGFVIAHVATARERDWRTYARSRLLRIGPMALAALVLTAGLDAAGLALRPELYGPQWGYAPAGQPWRFLLSLLFLNQLWTLDVAPGSDLPFWSLGFEVWYYVIFGLALFARRGLAWAALACVVAGPRIASMFPLWLAGAGCQLLCTRLARRGMTAGWAFPAAVLALAATEAWGLRHGWPAIPASWTPWVQAGAVRGYVVGLLFCLTILGLAVAPPWGAVLAGAVRQPVRWLAGATFSLYLFHMPVAQFLAAANPWPAGLAAGRGLVLGGTLAACLLLAEAVERRKDGMRRLLAGGAPGRRASSVPGGD